MNSKAQGALLLLSSMVISSVLTYLLTKAKYEKRTLPKPDIQETKMTKSNKEIELEQNNSQEDIVTKYADKYIRKNSELTRDYAPEQEKRPEIEFIDYDIFNTDDDKYDKVGFTLFSDGVLVNEQNKIVTDYQNNVGYEAVQYFDDHEVNGTVWVRNHKWEMDYEIVRDPRSYQKTFGGRANGRS